MITLQLMKGTTKRFKTLDELARYISIILREQETARDIKMYKHINDELLITSCYLSPPNPICQLESAREIANNIGILRDKITDEIRSLEMGD